MFELVTPDNCIVKEFLDVPVDVPGTLFSLQVMWKTRRWVVGRLGRRVLHCRGTGCSMRESMRGAMWKTRRWVVGRLVRRVHYGRWKGVVVGRLVRSVKEVRMGIVTGTECVGDENVIFVFKATFV